MEVTRIDHLVLTVEDIETTCVFYSNVLGAKTVTFDRGRKAVQIGGQKVNLHPAGDEFEPKAARPTPGAGDFCVITELSVDEVRDRLDGAGIEIVEGPVEKTGARGPLISVYVRDPDGNLVEIATKANRSDG
ncbi:VOC family protein [Halegenticoccus tardaugens]|uniref:VOC family protein n=1 Tax=Halegenticoccus tardaugens TaxID=2071624 RepID=UPI00100AE842|nr:VOC family protein [Halegenticoccus tardaugens]